MSSMFVVVALSLVLAEPDSAAVVVEKLTSRMIAAERALTDVHTTFHRREYMNGKLKPLETMTFKWRRAGDIYMKWHAPKNLEGRELLWRKGWKEMKLKDVVTLSLDPRGWLVMRESRHSIFDAGISRLTEMIVADTRRSQKYGGTKVTLLPARKVHGRDATCYVADQNKLAHPDFTVARAEVCVDDVTGLPISVQLWNVEDGELRVVEEYSYSNVKTNVGLTDADFDEDNPAYDF